MARPSAPSILNSESGLARYLQEAQRFPLLTRRRKSSSPHDGANMGTATQAIGW
jgi:hypothetical protein